MPSLNALRLGAARDAVAIADVSVADLMSNLSDEQKAGLAAQLSPQQPGGNAEGGAAKDGKDKKDKEMKDGDKEDEQPGSDAADTSSPQFLAGAASERARMAALMAHEHFEGRETLACSMFAETTMSAEAIGKALARLPKGGGSNADLIAALKNENQDLGAGGEDEPDANAAANNHGWGKAVAKANKLRGLGKKAA